MHSAEQNTDRPTGGYPARWGRRSGILSAQAAGKMAGQQHIELLSKAVAVWEALRDRPEGCSLHELTVQTGQVKSSIHRILRTLLHHGYIEQDLRGREYRLGLQFLVLANSIRGAVNIVRVAQPHSRALMETFNESTYIAVLREGRGIFVDVQETRRDLRLVGPLGAQVHYHATAAGKAMAAFFPEDSRKRLLSRLDGRPITGRTLITRGQVEREWDKVRRAGHAVNDEETIVGAIFLGAPLFDSSGAVCGSISIGLPKPRYSAAAGKRIAARLIECCRRVSEALQAAGYVHENGFEDERTRSAERRID